MKKKKPTRMTNQAWWNKFSAKAFVTEALLALSEPVYLRYPHLSSEHLFYLTLQIQRCISLELRSDRCTEEAAQLDTINAFCQIVEKQAGTSEQWGYIFIFAEINKGSFTGLRWALSNAIGTQANGLPAPADVMDYALAAQELVREITHSVFKHFYNFLVTLGEPSATQQAMIAVLQAFLQKNEPSPLTIKNNLGLTDSARKQVKFVLPPLPVAEHINVVEHINKENLPPKSRLASIAAKIFKS